MPISTRYKILQESELLLYFYVLLFNICTSLLSCSMLHERLLEEKA